jgi:hypothetical protein
MTKRAVPLAERRNRPLDERGADTPSEDEPHDHDSRPGAIASTVFVLDAARLVSGDDIELMSGGSVRRVS